MSEFIDKLIDKLRSKNYSITKENGRILVETTVNNLVEVMEELKRMGVDHVKSLTAIDYPHEGKIEVRYILGSYSVRELYGTLVIVTLSLTRSKPSLLSLTKLFPSIAYHERECHEMFGIKFDGNHDLRHLLLSPEDFTEVYPLRKEFKIEEEGIMA